MNPTSDPRRTQPITIPSARARPRNVSISDSPSSSSSGSDSIPTTPPRTRIQIPSPSNSPILSYFLTQSPSSPTSNNTFPFRKFGTSTSVFEAEDEERSIPATFHARRASAAIASKFTQQASPDTHTERANNLLRRLSLCGPTPQQKPVMDQPVTPTKSTMGVTPTQKPRRSATVSTSNRPRRAPSPMGERILKGHFDGFN